MLDIKQVTVITTSDGREIPLPYDEISKGPINYRYNCYIVKKGFLKGLIDGDGNEVLSPICQDILDISLDFPDLIIVKINASYGLFNLILKEIVVQPKYDCIEDFGGDFPEYRQSSFVEKIDSKIEARDRFLLRTKKDGLYGFFDVKAGIEYEPAYDFIGHFHNGVAPVKRNGKWGLLNRKGLLIDRIDAKSITLYKSYFYIVDTGYNKTVLDKDGNDIFFDIYADIFISERQIILKVHHQAIHAVTELILEPEYVDGKVTFNHKIFSTYQTKVIKRTEDMDREIEEMLDLITNN